MAETLYSLSTVGGDTLWESSDPHPTRPDVPPNDILDLARPLYFRADGMLAEAGLTVAAIRQRALELVRQQPRSTIAAHPTVLEDPARAPEEVSLWYLPSDKLQIPELDALYAGGLLTMAQLRAPEEIVQCMGRDQEPYCLFVTEVKPSGSRMDIHVDGRKSVIVNLSEPEHRGRSLLGHPDLRRYGHITLGMLLEDERTLVQKLFPGCGVAFDVTAIPHVGVSDPGTEGYRFILDTDYQFAGKEVDLTVYDSYA